MWRKIGLTLMGTFGALVLSAQVMNTDGIVGIANGFSQAAADLLYWPLAGGPITVAADMDVTLSGGVNGFSLDGDTFSVDATNNRVGVGDSTPAALLTVGSGDLLQMTSAGLVRGPTGSAAAPTYSFTADTSTGIYRAGPGNLIVSTSGNPNVSITDGRFDFGANAFTAGGDYGTLSTPVDGSTYLSSGAGEAGTRSLNLTSNNYSGEIRFRTNAGAGTTQRMVVAANGNVGIPSPLSDSKFYVLNDNAQYNAVRIEQTGTVTGPLLDVISYTGASPGNTGMRFASSRGTKASPSAVLSGDPIGGFDFGGQYDTTYGNWASSARIQAQATENFTLTTLGASLNFYTVPNGNNNRFNRMTIDQNGNVGVGDTSPAALFTVGSGDLFQVSSAGAMVVSSTSDLKGSISNSGASNGGAVHVADDLTVTGLITARATAPAVTWGLIGDRNGSLNVGDVKVFDQGYTSGAGLCAVGNTAYFGNGSNLNGGTCTAWGVSFNGTTVTTKALIASDAKNKGTKTLAAGTGTVTVTTGAICTCSPTATLNPCSASVSGTTLTLTGTGTDTLAYLCL